MEQKNFSFSNFFVSLKNEKVFCLAWFKLFIFNTFCPHFANTFSVVGNALTTRQKNEAIIQAIKNNYI